MSLAYFITHPDVVIDPAVAVPDWRLSALGIARMRAFAKQPWLSSVRALFCSRERKAVDGAAILAEALGFNSVVLEALAENDRSATGYLAKDEFEKTADAFFARAHESVRGWERAVDAQRRIIAAMDEVLRLAPIDGDVAVTSHGGVGALYLSHLKGRAIDRSCEQPAGNGGNFFAFERHSRRLVLDWRSIDER